LIRPTPNNGLARRRLLAAAIEFSAIWYFLLERILQHLPLDPFHPALLGQAFNSMAEHLVAGRFDIDPEAIGGEAFLDGDRSYSYFGVFCALLRLPLLPFPALAHLDITRLSCLVAICLGVWFQLRAVLLVRDASSPGPRRDWLTAALVVCILLGGQQIQFLRASVYQEVVDWANAFAMGFVFLALRGLLHGFGVRTLTGMAIFAGLALLDRVSFGLGLYAALGGVLLLHWRSALWPALVMAVFVVAVGIVNQGRWGNPTIFADFTKYAMDLDQHPDRLVRLAEYGPFNPRRLGLGLSYYFLPIEPLLLSDTARGLVDAMELPFGSFLVSDPLLLGLAFFGARRVAPSACVLLLGLAVPAVLMLTAISMNYRYRVEFYPFLVLAALLGSRPLSANPAPFGRKARTAILAAVVASVLVSHAMAALYAVSPFGPAEQYIAKDGWIGTYAPRLRVGHD
jgi:hypothetical protein